MRGPTQEWAQRGAYGLERTTETFGASRVVKNPPTNARDPGSIPGLGRSPGRGNGNTLNTLAWGIPWTEEPGKELDMSEPLNNNRDSWLRIDLRKLGD